MNHFSRFAVIFLVIFLWSCEGKKEQLPTYLHIPNVNFQYTNVSELGNGGTAITDAWVYDNDNLLGVFELPATIAVLGEGNRKITVSAGIKLNGISSTREYYAFYQPWIENFDFSPLDTITLNPVVSYYAETGISFKEEFQNSTFSIDTLSSSDVDIERVFIENQPTYLDNYVAKAVISEATPGFKAYTKELFIVPTTSSLPIYLEMDYKCNQELVIGVIIKSPSTGTNENRLISLRSTVENGEMVWKHIYIDLTDQFAGQVDATGFGITFTSLYNGEFPEGEIYFDNVKVVNQK
jgi:hypothetical protein